MLTEAGEPGEFPPNHAVSGRTTLVSPSIPLDQVAAARLECARWDVNSLAGGAGAFTPNLSVSGRTTLVSPSIPLDQVAAARLEFALWYVNYLAGSTWQ